jgi:hypothetical protein
MSSEIALQMDDFEREKRQKSGFGTSFRLFWAILRIPGHVNIRSGVM